jgi:hypothetical protein
MMKLVNVLMQAIADRQGMTQTADAMFLFTDLAAAVKTLTRDATYVEQDHPRDEGGRWSAGAHQAAAEAHEGMGTPDHQEAAEAHHAAAKHMTSQTGLGAHMSQAAQAASKKLGGVPSAQNNSMGAAYGKLKAIAADPSAPVLKRSEAIKQLGAIEKAAGEVAESPHAVVPPKPVAAGPAGAPGAPAGGNAVGAKPTQSTAKGAKPAVHQLLSSGHPFSVDELMKATGVTNKVTIMTALSDLKNPKYAGQLGALTIEKGADGMYKVTKAPAGGFKAVGAANAPAGAAGANQATAVGDPTGPMVGEADPNKVVHGSHPLSDFMPGQMLTAKGVKGNQYKVLGHNDAGGVVVEGPGGVKHNMEPSALKAAMQPPAAKADLPAQPPESAHTIKEAPSAGLKDGPGTPDPSIKTATTSTEARSMRAKAVVASKAKAKQDARSAANIADPRYGATPEMKAAHERAKVHAAEHDEQVRAATGAAKPGPAGGSALPLRATPKGDVNPVQNVQARIDSKAAGKGRIDRALGNHSSTFVAQALGQPKPGPGQTPAEKAVGKTKVDAALGNHSQGLVKKALGAKPGPDGKPMGTHPALAAAQKAVAANPRTMNVDPISHRTSMAGGVPHSNTSKMTPERAAANAKHMAGLEAARTPAAKKTPGKA